MISIKDILFEEASNYKVSLRVTHSKELNTTELADIVRSIRGVTIVRMLRTEETLLPRSIFSVKIRTSKDPKIMLGTVKQELLSIPNIRKVDIAFKTLEKES